ncbi:MAG: hypothetical protein IPP25_17705 [Saprospiraceae bacterium]|nr:hypothetical protein [Candidatus Opimibacter skivensis]
MMIENDLLGYFACTSLGYAKSEYVYNLVVMDINFKITKDKLISSTMPMKQNRFQWQSFLHGLPGHEVRDLCHIRYRGCTGR